MMTPTIAPEAADGIYALMAFLADKDACAARLDALQAAADDARVVEGTARVLQKQAEVARAEMERTRDEIAAQNADALRQTAEYRRQAEDLLSRSKIREAHAAEMLAAAEARDNAFIATSEQTRKELETAATGVTEREARVAEREKNLAEAEMKANDLVREYQEKLAKLQSLIA